MPISLVTGAGGFIGSWLIKYLSQRGDTVIAIARHTTTGYPSKLDGIVFHNGDVTDEIFINDLIQKYEPDEIYHLASQSSPSKSWEKPLETMQINYGGSLAILNAVKKNSLATSIVLVSSSSLYAPSINGDVIFENGLIWPSTPYGVSKLAADCLASIYSKAYQMRVMSVRPFFIIGPGKTGDVCSDWAKGIVMVERGLEKTLMVGGIEGIERDFMSIYDALSGLTVVARYGASGEAYNLCSGHGYALTSLLSFLKSKSTSRIPTEVDLKRIRPIEELKKVGNNEKLRRLGWGPTLSVEKTLEEILNYWRAQRF